MLSFMLSLYMKYNREVKTDYPLNMFAGSGETHEQFQSSIYSAENWRVAQPQPVATQTTQHSQVLILSSVLRGEIPTRMTKIYF